MLFYRHFGCILHKSATSISRSETGSCIIIKASNIKIHTRERGEIAKMIQQRELIYGILRAKANILQILNRGHNERFHYKCCLHVFCCKPFLWANIMQIAKRQSATGMYVAKRSVFCALVNDGKTLGRSCQLPPGGSFWAATTSSLCEPVPPLRATLSWPMRHRARALHHCANWAATLFTADQFIFECMTGNNNTNASLKNGVSSAVGPFTFWASQHGILPSHLPRTQSEFVQKHSPEVNLHARGRLHSAAATVGRLQTWPSSPP